MGLSLGGGWNSQSGNSQGSTTSNQNSNTSQTNSGSQMQSGTTTGTNTVNTTGIYDNAGASAAGNLDSNGFTSAQAQALARQSGAVAGQPMGWALQGVNGQLNDLIANPNIPSVSGGQANNYTASQFMAPYEQTYANDVLTPSLALFDQNAGNQYAGMKAARDAGSAFGDRSALADNDFFAKQGLARAGVAGTALGTGYNVALGAGEGDAAKALGASIANASNATTASVANASNALTGRGQNLQALGQAANNDATTNTIGLENNQALFNMGGGGQSNLLSLMGSQVPAFGGTSGSASNTASTFDSLMNSIFSGSGSGTSNNNFNTSGFTKGGGIG